MVNLNRIYQSLLTKARVNAGPYTGNTAPQYGQALESQTPYADMVQEMYMSKPPQVSTKAVVSVKLPRVGTGINPERGDLPAGSDTVQIARWDGEKWVMLVRPDELKRKFARAMKPYRSSVASQWTQDFDTFLKELPEQAPESLKKHIIKNDKKISDRLNSQSKRNKKKKRQESSNKSLAKN